MDDDLSADELVPGFITPLKIVKHSSYTKVATGDAWSVTALGSFDGFACHYGEDGRQLRFQAYRVDPDFVLKVGKCNWRWEGESETISPRKRALIVKRIVASVKGMFQPPFDFTRLEEEAGLRPPAPRIVKPRLDNVVQVDEGHLRYSHAGRSITVPIEFGKETFGELHAEIKFKAIEHWDAPHDKTRLAVEDRAMIIAMLSQYVSQNHHCSVLYRK